MAITPISGIERLDFAPAYKNIADAPLDAAWRRVENINNGTVSLTQNEDSVNQIIPEDKDVAEVTLSTPGEADTFNFSTLDFTQENFADLFNVAFDAATSTTTFKAQRKVANLAIRMTTRPVNGIKYIITFPNTDARSRVENPFTKDGLVQISATATILSFIDADGEEATRTMQMVKADGTVIDSTPAVPAG
ncbi:hypothetical protein I2I11_04200 [Pontibacter sp. 172403-2]|uniref:hypothetical protein n=1 Tax=Pontibacter rufus TaxID=2791028 RepID=UPI0018AFB011|nr:hypothetical protein [Pontibacter sp. 172403-2]MBF9252486.1 hypothetical protein [Pontibacter sp. 172403-2]